jgi:multicomponent Na+:H+ antiporter subunit B
MISLILATAARVVQPLLLLFSIFVLVRGHNAPGGGFAGGLVAAIAFILLVVAYDPDTARRSLRVNPRHLLAVGLLVAAASGLVGLALGEAFLAGIFFDLPVLAGGRIALSTVFFFDVGVYFTVIGVTLTIVFALAEATEDQRDDAARTAAREEASEWSRPWS